MPSTLRLPCFRGIPRTWYSQPSGITLTSQAPGRCPSCSSAQVSHLCGIGFPQGRSPEMTWGALCAREVYPVPALSCSSGGFGVLSEGPLRLSWGPRPRLGTPSCRRRGGGPATKPFGNKPRSGRALLLIGSCKHRAGERGAGLGTGWVFGGRVFPRPPENMRRLE